jgi:hypothetical protein
MSWLCGLEVHGSKEKSLLLLGLFATSSRGEYMASAKLAEKRGFEPLIRNSGFQPSGDYLLRNDWLSRLIGSLLCLLGRSRGASRITPCRVVCSAGLGWCGGWRRASVRGSHDQVQIEDQRYHSVGHPKNQ